MNAIGYCRVSTDIQANEGASLDAQQARIRAWAQLHGATILRIEIDAGLSGGRADNRPGLKAAVSAACKEKAALVVYSLSRLARSTRDALSISERLEHAGAALVSLSENLDTTSAAGKMIFRLLAVMAEFERDQISERVKTVMAHLRRSGRVYGEIPYGYDSTDGKTLIPNHIEQMGLNIMMRLRTRGQTLDEIGLALEQFGLVTKYKKLHWRSHTVYRILLRCARDFPEFVMLRARARRKQKATSF